jgi:hypothetical protein
MATNQKSVFVLQPFSHEFDSVFEAIITPAVRAAGGLVRRTDQISVVGSIIEEVYKAIEQAHVLICDISNSNPNVMYELGYAHALQKPVIMICHEPEHMPFDVRGLRVLYYDISMANLSATVRELQELIQRAFQHVFISYSHRDNQYLKRLLVHLKPLEKKGIIDLWVDTSLSAGDRWKKEIEEALRRARVAILLVSADFLASEFIVDNELPPLLAKAEEEGTRVIPVIIRPCRFTRDENLKHFQAINDPSRPVGNLAESEQEIVYDMVSQLVERSIVK